MPKDYFIMPKIIKTAKNFPEIAKGFSAFFVYFCKRYSNAILTLEKQKETTMKTSRKK